MKLTKTKALFAAFWSAEIRFMVSFESPFLSQDYRSFRLKQASPPYSQLNSVFIVLRLPFNPAT